MADLDEDEVQSLTITAERKLIDKLRRNNFQDVLEPSDLHGCCRHTGLNRFPLSHLAGLPLYNYPYFTPQNKAILWNLGVIDATHLCHSCNAARLSPGRYEAYAERVISHLPDLPDRSRNLTEVHHHSGFWKARSKAFNRWFSVVKPTRGLALPGGPLTEAHFYGSYFLHRKDGDGKANPLPYGDEVDFDEWEGDLSSI